jgi:glutamine synthetase
MTMTAGIHGLEENFTLKHSDCRLNPVELGEEERAELGIVKPLPTSLKDSIKMLEDSTTFDAIPKGKFEEALGCGKEGR